MISSTAVFKDFSFSRILSVTILLILCSTLSLVSCRNELIDEIELMRRDASSPVIELNIDGETPLAQGSEIDCDQVSVGSTYELTLNINNTGRSALIIDLSGINLTMSSDTEENTFTVVKQPSEQIDVDGNSTLTIRFTPFSGGQKSATLSIPTNDFNNPVFTFSITGDGWAVVLTTNDISNIEMTTATGGGEIESDGGESIRERGICWGTNPNPTINDNSQSAESVGLGSYSTFMTGLNAGTLYYVRAYASNSTTTGYGSQVSFTTKPSSPTGLSAVPVGYPEGSGKLKVSWASENGPSTYYDVYYNTTDTPPASANGPTNLTQKSCTLTGLTNYDVYYIWIKAKNSSGTSLISNSCNSKVGIELSTITLNKSSGTFLIEYSETLTATVSPLNATNLNILWNTDNGFASVSAGTVTGIGVGTTAITATAADGRGAISEIFSATTKSFQLLDSGPAGGILFYDKEGYSDGWRYLEVATSQVGENHSWYNGSYINIPDALSHAYGAGKENTDAIIAAQGSGAYFAMACHNYTQSGYSDWYMPSAGEVNEILVEIHHTYDLYNKFGLWGIATSSQHVSVNTRNYVFNQSVVSPYSWGLNTLGKHYTKYNYVTWPVRRF